TYSDVITIAGKTKGKGGGNNNLLVSTVDEEETLTGKPTNRFGNLTAGKITVGPNPNNGNFWFSVNGIEKEIIAILYTIDGKQIQQFRVVNQQQQKVNGIRSGMYLLKVPGFETQKIMVNSGGSGAPVQGQTITNNSKL
ncbi:MAG TPA: T9SS type A sorting domain-containing protein, partial [Chitinophagaceae bacterium]